MCPCRYLEFKKSEQDVGELSRFVQAHDLYCAEQAQQKCAEAAAEGKARQAELSAAMDQADKDKKEKKKAIEKALAKKSKEGTGEIKTLEKTESELSKQLVKLGAAARAKSAGQSDQQAAAMA